MGSVVGSTAITVIIFSIVYLYCDYKNKKDNIDDKKNETDIGHIVKGGSIGFFISLLLVFIIEVSFNVTDLQGYIAIGIAIISCIMCGCTCVILQELRKHN